MPTPEQLAANQANAQLSTGPKTPAGKARASRNAVQHGLQRLQAVHQGQSVPAPVALDITTDISPEHGSSPTPMGGGR